MKYPVEPETEFTSCPNTRTTIAGYAALKSSPNIPSTKGPNTNRTSSIGTVSQNMSSVDFRATLNSSSTLSSLYSFENVGADITLTDWRTKVVSIARDRKSVV